MHKFTKALAAIGLAAVMSQSAMAENLKLGFLVKQPEEPWFQTEWKFADKAGKDLGFEVIKIAVPDGEKTLNAIDSLAASGAKGFVICTPDPKLGSAIVAKARGYDMKVIAVDDQFVNAKGKPMDTVPLVMMAATKIGERQGQELYKEMQKRGWDVKESAVMAITSNDLPEVLGVADRIVVMREGEIAGELLHEQADERQALSLAMPKVSQAVA
ncbi:substrate-binding domain-containing protein [Escherichia coli]|nr:substrate-binding domain-containing protein [Escherichia coli]